jgi:hypothetical protein
LVFLSHRLICSVQMPIVAFTQEYSKVYNSQGSSNYRLSRGLHYGEIMNTHMEEPQL